MNATWTPAAMQSAVRHKLTRRERDQAEARARRADPTKPPWVICCDVYAIVEARAAEREGRRGE